MPKASTSRARASPAPKASSSRRPASPAGGDGRGLPNLHSADSIRAELLGNWERDGGESVLVVGVQVSVYLPFEKTLRLHEYRAVYFTDTEVEARLQLMSWKFMAQKHNLPPPEYPLIRTDYRLGPHEPMLYPQMWHPTAPHMAWVEKHELHRELHQGDIVAYVFQYHDWNPSATMSDYGRISGDLLCRLDLMFHEIYVKTLPFLKSARTRLLVPATMITECMRLLSDLRVLTPTFKDSATMVTRIQRGISELRAFRLFRLDVQHHVGDQSFVSDRVFNYVGVFTSDRAMTDLLHRLGVPVWLVVSGLPRGFQAQPPVPFSKLVETKPLNQLDEYHTDWAGRRQRNRDASPPSYSAPSATDPHAVPQARTSQRRSRSPPRTRYASTEQGGSSSGPLSRRSRSPGASRGQALPVSTVPRYILHEQPRLKDSATRKHPDAPPSWRPRDWVTDPGHQAAQGLKVPIWVPQLPQWLLDVAASVDRSVTREWRLCANDCIHPVPQDVFNRPLSYCMPPLHLLLKHEKRFQYVFAAWAALRDFWLRRLSDGDECALSATIWRKILDDKYNISKELAMWIENNAPQGVSPTATVAQAPVPSGGQGQAEDAHIASLRTQIQDAHLSEVTAVQDTRSSLYTRLGQAGEDLAVTTSCETAEPANWSALLPHLEVYCEIASRRIHRIDARCFTDLRTGGGLRWDEYWDYDGKRIVLFDRRSQVPREHPTHVDSELLLNEGALTWHLSPTDEEGLASPSRAVWRATAGLATDSEGALIVFSDPGPVPQTMPSGASNAPIPHHHRIPSTGIMPSFQTASIVVISSYGSDNFPKRISSGGHPRVPDLGDR
ncbi:hypothetical protein AURDEDRAFT_176121 [Auricularia subglabra TFB-10046 SS5]|uniref:Uncharacterized protein n=1 Tax=Auricularia subglabra (strain TFB-10046 / SS5) TaxID=717982 RepID=J0D767_AURST|nr:hypothetical protein AURDEDRAFT_176121 [Auricularia subglabra TFB-10046 SS5]